MEKNEVRNNARDIEFVITGRWEVNDQDKITSIEKDLKLDMDFEEIKFEKRWNNDVIVARMKNNKDMVELLRKSTCWQN